MRPEVWVAIRQDWKESLPAVLAGHDDKFYQDGWATKNAAPRSVKTSFYYLCWHKGWQANDMLSMARDAAMCFKRDALVFALWRKHTTSISNMASVMHRDHSSISSLLRRAREKMKRADFADLVKEIEALL